MNQSVESKSQLSHHREILQKKVGDVNADPISFNVNRYFALGSCTVYAQISISTLICTYTSEASSCVDFWLAGLPFSSSIARRAGRYELGRYTVIPYPYTIARIRLAASVSGEMQEKPQKSLIIQCTSGGGEQALIMILGHDAALLIDVCNAVAHAQRSGNLGKRYDKVVLQAAIINGACAKSWAVRRSSNT